MYKNMKILSLIPARGGSKGIKNKNIIELAGRPLISYTIDASIGSRYVDRTVVSTDSEDIARVSKECGADVPFMRPTALATDTAKTLDVVLHAIETLRSMSDEYDILILLQPTQPLRDCHDVDRAIEFFFKNGMRNLASVSLVDDNPLLIRTISDDGSLIHLLNENSTCRRQDMKDYYRINGCIYINGINDISEETSFNDNPLGFVISQDHSVDIDEFKDLTVAEYYMKKDTERLNKEDKR